MGIEPRFVELTSLPELASSSGRAVLWFPSIKWGCRCVRQYPDAGRLGRHRVVAGAPLTDNHGEDWIVQDIDVVRRDGTRTLGTCGVTAVTAALPVAQVCFGALA